MDQKLQLTTPVDIEPSTWRISPCERMLFVGSCFADNMGKRFVTEKFRAIVNPFGVMYNPASILHTVQQLADTDQLPFAPDEPGTAVFTLGTNHVYILNETGEIVDNCQKRPQRLFTEQELTIEECTDYLSQTIQIIRSRFPKVRIILTVSPIRYRKYGFHGSRLSKAVLLLAIDRLIHPKDSIHSSNDFENTTVYFPSYEIMNDELRDYRFYKPDMLHPSDQAVDYIFQRMAETFFSPETHDFLRTWKPIREAFDHRPFDPDSAEYQAFHQHTLDQAKALQQQYPGLVL